MILNVVSIEFEPARAGHETALSGCRTSSAILKHMAWPEPDSPVTEFEVQPYK